MIDPAILRQEPKRVKKALEDRGVNLDLDEIIALDKARRELVAQLENSNQLKNKANDEIGALLKANKDTSTKIKSMKEVSQKISELKPRAEEAARLLEEKLLLIPNLPSADCPVGKDASANQVVSKPDSIPKLPFKPKDHIKLAEALGLVDFKRSSKLSGSSFVLFTGEGARLERALINFMLDVHRKNGYLEISPPVLVKRHCMQGTGQLPKFEDDMYRVYRGKQKSEDGKPHENDLFLIPTAEVPLTNMHRLEGLDETTLPLAYTAYTPCFRLEAGTYGKETKGMVRVHQFDKVELMKFSKPQDSYKELEALRKDAESIMLLLELPYRVLLLSTGDMGFAAAKCYDIEVWAPGTGTWLEVSSCSNFEDFQARRSGIKFKDKTTKKSKFVHTLNGSGVALARTFIALLENKQQADGSILIPEALRPYMGGQTHIKKSR
jgi:seryl-tRNA synthetase